MLYVPNYCMLKVNNLIITFNTEIIKQVDTRTPIKNSLQYSNSVHINNRVDLHHKHTDKSVVL